MCNDVHGAKRWIKIGSTSFQPSEAMKPVLVVVVAFLLIKYLPKDISPTKKFIPLLVVMAPVCARRWFCSAIYPDCLSVRAVCLRSGSKRNALEGHIQARSDFGCVALVAAVIFSVSRGGGLSYIFDRIASMSSVEDGEINDDTWQTAQSLIAIGSGGWCGLGFGESRQKYFWLPESQNDFIISIIVEELGYLGGLTVLILFGLLVYRGFRIARKAPDKFGMLITTGLVFQMGFQGAFEYRSSLQRIPEYRSVASVFQRRRNRPCGAARADGSSARSVEAVRGSVGTYVRKSDIKCLR